MQWSDKIGKKKIDLGSEDVVVVDYKPQVFPLKQSNVSEVYQSSKKSGTDFILSNVVKKISGIEEIEKNEEKNQIEQQVLTKITEVQQEAYEQAKKLGYDDGFKQAYADRKEEIENYISVFAELVNSIQNIKPELVHQNEAHLVKLTYQIASRLLYSHIEEDPNVVLPVIEKSIEAAQADEEINLYISPSQYQTIKEIQDSSERKFDFLKNVKLLPSDDIAPGGCVVETNYGEIDARVEERVKKMGDEVFKSVPKIKKIAG